MIRFLKNLFWTACLAFTLRACIIEPVRTQDDAMSPKVVSGDVVLVSKLAYGLRVPGAGTTLWRWHPIRKGDLVVAVDVGDPPLSVMRRVGALPGERVTVPNHDTGVPESIVIPKGFFYLSSDQPDNVMDSRSFGLVSRRAIIGRATHIWIPSHQNASTGGDSKVNSFLSRIFQKIL